MKSKKTLHVGTIVLFLLLLTLISSGGKALAENDPVLIFPFMNESGIEWEIYQGYLNTPSGSHQGIDEQFAFDLTTTNLSLTKGRPVYSPVNGEIAWVGTCSGEIAIRIGPAPNEGTITNLYWFVQIAHMQNRQYTANDIGKNVVAGVSHLGDASNILNCGTYPIDHIHMVLYKAPYNDCFTTDCRIGKPFENLEGFAWPSDPDSIPGTNVTSGNNGTYSGIQVWRGMGPTDVGLLPNNSCTKQPGDGNTEYASVFISAFNNAGGQDALGCPKDDWTGDVHDTYGIWLQDFNGTGSKGGCAIIYNQSQGQARAVCDPYTGTYFSVNSWWDTLGAPTSDVFNADPESDPLSNGQGFEHGDIYSTSYGNFAVYGSYMDVYRNLNGTGGILGYPKSTVFNADPISDDSSWGQGFVNGDIYYTTEFGTHAVVDDFMDVYRNWGGTGGSLGYPKTDQERAASFVYNDGTYDINTEGSVQGFVNGDMYSSDFGTYAVVGNIFKEFVGNEGTSMVGFPIGTASVDLLARVTQYFQRGYIRCSLFQNCSFTAMYPPVRPGVGGPGNEPPDTTIVDPTVCTDGNNVTFTFIGTDDVTAPEDLLFTYRLDDEDWPLEDAVTQVTYPSVTPIDHVFSVAAVDQIGDVDPTPAEVTFSVDTTPPSTTASLTGTEGNNGWYVSNVSIGLSATDTGCGSANVVTHYKVNGGTAQTYTGPINLGTDGIYTIEYWSQDGVGNLETMQTVDVSIDTTPPQAAGTATGPRDTNGLFRGDVTIDFNADDNLSGVDTIAYSTDGSNWIASTGAAMVTGNGTTFMSYYVTDVAGNTSIIYDSGPIIINQYVVFANQTGESLLVDSTTGITITGDVHTNGSARLIRNTSSTINGTVSAVGSVTADYTNTNLTIGSIQNNAPNVPMLDYPLLLYQSMCDSEYTGNLVINSVSQSMDGIYCVNGDLTLRSVSLSGPVTFVVTGDIFEEMVGSDLQTNDPFNGVMMIAGGNIVLSGNAYDLLGLVYAPNGTITVSGNDVRINGSLVGQNIVFDSTGWDFDLSYDAAFANGTFNLPLTDSVFVTSGTGTIPTPEPTQTPTETPQATATPQPTATPSPTPEPTATPQQSNEATLFISTLGSQYLSTISWKDEDIVSYDTALDSWAMFIDGSNIDAEDIDALHMLPDGSLLVSFDWSADLPGIANDVEPEDIARFIPTHTGSTTTGTWELYFDGSDVGLDGENIVALHILDSGALVVAFDDDFDLPGYANIQPEDLAIFTPTQLGNTTTGTWNIYLDGSDTGLEDTIDGLWIDTNGALYLTIDWSWNGAGFSIGKEDVFVCTPLQLGETSSCDFGSGVFFDGSSVGMTGDIDALFVFK